MLEGFILYDLEVYSKSTVNNTICNAVETTFFCCLWDKPPPVSPPHSCIIKRILTKATYICQGNLKRAFLSQTAAILHLPYILDLMIFSNNMTYRKKKQCQPPVSQDTLGARH